ncbi:hypothetical protein [Streptomyces virginiae]|uniref:hypothetical protein n=1 Tax=Streptomyces virginiae TaxID=1961 RepID=UPI00362F255E
MAGMWIVVCLPGEARTRLDEALAEAMAPFAIDFTRGEDMDIWDAWGICGNGTHRDGLQLLPGYEDDPRIVRDRSDEGVPGWCAGGPREAMAFAEIRAEAREIARAAWDLWRELSRSHPPAEPRRVVWDSPWPTPEEYRAGHQAEQEARAAFEGRPLVIAYREGVAALLEAQRGYDLGGCDGPDACVHRPPLPWLRGATRTGYLEELPGDTLLVKLRCHVRPGFGPPPRRWLASP